MPNPLTILLAAVPAVALAQPEPVGEPVPLAEAMAAAAQAGAAIIVSHSDALPAADLSTTLAEATADWPADWVVTIADPMQAQPGAGLSWSPGVCQTWRGGDLVDWDPGFADQDALAEWLSRTENDTIDAEYARARADALDNSAMASASLAFRLARLELPGQAATAYLACFDDLSQIGPAFLLRVTPEMRRLAGSSDEAREAFKAAAAEKLEAATLGVQDPNHDLAIFLHSAALEAVPYAEWLNGKERELTEGLTPESQPSPQLLQQARTFAQRRRKSVQLLLYCRDYPAIAELCWVAPREVGAVFAGLPAQPPAPDQTEPAFDRRRFEAASHVGVMYASLLSVGRDQQAAQLVDELRQTWDSPYAIAAVIQMALGADQAREEHIAWAERVDEELPPDRLPGGRPMTELVREALGQDEPPAEH